MNVPAVADCVARRPDADSIFRRINNLALASFDLWVPALGLRRRYRSGSGYTAVAEWRASSSGRPFERQEAEISVFRRMASGISATDGAIRRLTL